MLRLRALVLPRIVPSKEALFYSLLLHVLVLGTLDLLIRWIF